MPDENNKQVISGKVGINCDPHEALTVAGNVFYTGDLIKPSDRRIKRNIAPLRKYPLRNFHRKNISNIQLYEYERVDLGSETIRYIKERGVIAQEVQRVLPSAVVTLPDTRLPDGTIVPEMLAVNDRELLIETIGATQELSEETELLQSEVDGLATESKEHRTVIQSLAAAIVTLTRREAPSDSRFNMFGIGPAWTGCILGFFFPLFFFVGAAYIFSRYRHRQIAGLASLILLTFQSFEYFIFDYVSYQASLRVILYIYVGWWGFGVFVCCCIMLALVCKEKVVPMIRAKRTNNSRATPV